MLSHKFPRRLLAENVCPWAPFLLPIRAQLALLGNALTAPCSGFRAYNASTRRKAVQKAKKSRFPKRRLPLIATPWRSYDEYHDDLDTDKALLDFRASITSGNVQLAMGLYGPMLEKEILNRNDTMGLARMLHTHYRLNLGMTSEEKDELLQKFKRIIKDIKHGRLQPHPVAHVHIISYFKESKQFDLGEEHWKWLNQQDESQLDARTYGSVIELLAYRGESLAVLEDMYKEALARFPGQFSEYHLSPGAIIADPKQATAMAGTRMFLLQGILTARVLLGDWKNAYLALDTALRLYPTQVPSRFFEILIYERPLSEAYRIFLVACRCESPPGSKVFVHLLESLANTALSKNNRMTIPDNTKSMFNAMHAYIGSGGNVNHHHVNILANHILELLPPRPTCSTDTHKDTDGIFDAIIGLFYQLLRDAGMFGSASQISTYNNMITIGGKKRRRELVELAWKDLTELGLQPNNITYRVMLLAGAYLEDADMVKGAWEDLKAEKSERGPPDQTDWKAFARAAKRAGIGSLVESELPSDSDTVSEQIRYAVDKELKGGAYLQRPSAEPVLEANELLQLLDHLNERLVVIRELLQSRKRHDFYQNPLPMSLSSPTSPLITNPNLRDLYKKLSQDPALAFAPNTDHDQHPAATTAMKYPLDELRFQNWCAINILLLEAEQTEKLKLQAVDKAIATGRPVKRTKQGIRVHAGKGQSAKPTEVKGVEEGVVDSNLTGRSTSYNQKSGETAVESMDDAILRLRGQAT